MNKLYYVNITDYYSAIKMNELLIYATTWVNFKKHYNYMKIKARHKRVHSVRFHLSEVLRKTKIYNDEKQIHRCLSWVGLGIVTAKRHEGIGGGVIIVATWACAVVKTYQNVHLKYFHYV